MIELIYFVVIILANIIGAISGMGGGVIIKPIFDFIGEHSLVEISFYSSTAAFCMSILSTGKQIKNKMNIELDKVCLMSTGALIGGVIGNNLFVLLLQMWGNEDEVKLIQIAITIFVLIFTLIYATTNNLSMNLKYKGWYSIIGIILGTLSSLLGIGGGPINVAVLMLCFGITIKNATVYSIITILFSQFSKIVMIMLNEEFFTYDLSMLLYVVPASALGGFIGALCSSKCEDKHVKIIYQIVIFIVILINVYNGIALLL